MPSSLTYTSTNAASTSGNIIIVLGSSVTITNSTPAVTGTTVVYSVSPSLPSGLTLDTTTGSITGTPTANQSLTSYVVTGTYTAQTGYALNTSSAPTRTLKIYVNSSTTIANLTCNTSGVAAGCLNALAFSCTSSTLCYSSSTACYATTSTCIQ